MDKIKDGVEGAMARAELTARELSGSNSEVFDVSSYMIHKNQMGTAKCKTFSAPRNGMYSDGHYPATFQRIAQQQHLVDVEDDDPEQPVSLFQMSEIRANDTILSEYPPPDLDHIL